MTAKRHEKDSGSDKESLKELSIFQRMFKVFRGAYITVGLSLFSAALSLIAIASLQEKTFNGTEPVKVIIRYDDFGLFDKQLHGDLIERYSKEYEFIEFLVNNDIKACVGMVPFDKGDRNSSMDEYRVKTIDAVRLGVQKQILEVGLHGYDHSNNNTEVFPSEFWGQPRGTQSKWLLDGKNKIWMVTGRAPQIFIPPFNAWDENTLTALLENDFRIISAEANTYPRNDRIIYFPYTTTARELELLLDTKTLGNDDIVVVNIHPHDFKGADGSAEIYRVMWLLTRPKNEERKIELFTFHEAVSKGIQFHREELRKLSKMYRWLSFWRNVPLARKVIRTKSLSAYRPYYNNSILFFIKAALGIALCLIGFFTVNSAASRAKSKYQIWVVGIVFVGVFGLLLITSVEYWLTDQVIAYRRFVGITFVLGGVIAVVRSLAFREKDHRTEKA